MTNYNYKSDSVPYPRLQNSDRGLLSNNTSLKNNELCGITVNPDNSMQLNCSSTEDFIKQFSALRFLNPTKELKLRGTIKVDGISVTYYIHSRNLTIYSMIISYHHYATTNFADKLQFNNYLASCLQSEADDALLHQLES